MESEYQTRSRGRRLIASGRPLPTADSTDRRNKLAKAFRRCLEVERLSGPFVQSTSDGIELALRNIRQIYPLWELLPRAFSCQMPRPRIIATMSRP